MSKKAVMFDFDGTIVDSMKELAIVASGLINEYYQLSVTMAERIYIETSGLPFCEQMEIMFPGGSKNDEVVRIFEETKENNFWNYRVFPDTASVLKYLKDSGYLVAVSSNNFSEVIQRYLDKHGIAVDEVLGFVEGGDFFKGKPHFDYVIKKYDIDYKDITFIGDSFKDGEKAISNGIKFIGRTGTNTRENFISAFGNIKTVDDLSELRDLL